MALTLYRRHRLECEGEHAEDARSGEFEEGRRGWKKCACLIHVSGTLGGKFSRKQTGKSDWDEAKAAVAVWEAAKSWDSAAKIQEPAPPAPVVPDGRITIDRAIKAFTAEFQEHAATSTQKKYRLLLGKLKTFADSRGYVLVEQWGPIDVREFRSSWSVSAQTAAKNMSTIKAFFEYCVSNEWLPKNPARLVKNQRGRDAGDRRGEQKLPFTDDELRKMYGACETKYGKQEVKWSRVIHHERVEGEYARYNFKWTGQDVADFISVSVYTGLRISDVSTFHIDRMQSTGEIHVRTTKAGTHVYTWVPEWLQERIRARAQEHGPVIFGEHRTKDLNVITDVWRRKLKKLWTLCGPWKEEPTPHRFRHTFARILLERPGVTVRDVAELLGNSEQMVRKHYAAFVPERQERLTAVLKAAFSEKPKPNVIEMRKTGTK
jgi:site-specific recombinase XerD